MRQILPGSRTSEESLDACRFCGMCRHICPVGNLTREEGTTPRGWALAASGVVNGLITVDDASARQFYRCVSCHQCTDWCVSGYRPWEAVRDIRARLAGAEQAPAEVQAYRLGLRLLLAAPTPTASLTEQAPGTTTLVLDAADDPDGGASRAAETLIRRISDGGGVLRMDTGCEARELGLYDEADELARRTRARLPEPATGRFLIGGPAARRGLTEPGTHLGLDVSDLADWLTGLLDDGTLRPRRDLAASRVAVHDTCRGERSPDALAALRRLVAAFGGYVIEYAWGGQRMQSCGASGGLRISDPGLASRLGRALLEEAAALGADAVLAVGPDCAAHLAGCDSAATRPAISLLQFIADRAE